MTQYDEYYQGGGTVVGYRSGSLPLIRPDFSVYLMESDLAIGSQFPPERFRSRDIHLDELDAIYRGDFRRFVDDDDKVKVPISPARRLVTMQADLLMMSTPENKSEYPLRAVAADALRDMDVYGGAVIIVDNADAVDTIDASLVDDGAPMDGPNIYTASPLTWYPMDGGGCALVRPFFSPMAPSSVVHDRVEITRVPGREGPIYVSEHDYDGIGLYGSIGAMVEERQTGYGGVLLAARSPQEDIWGESLLLDLAAPLVELAKRFSQNSKILDENAKPTPVMSSGTDDALDAFPLTSDDSDDLTEYDKVVQGYANRLQQDVFWLNDRTQKVSYLEFSGQLPASFEQIRNVREMIAYLSGLPAILESLIAQAPSGISLKLQYLPWYAATKARQLDLTEVLSLALEMAGCDSAIEWPHIFDLLDGEREAAVASRREMMGMI